MTDTKIHSALTAVMRPLRARWRKQTLTNLVDVEELLDWLEYAGYEEWRVAVAGDAFVVRWR